MASEDGREERGRWGPRLGGVAAAAAVATLGWGIACLPTLSELGPADGSVEGPSPSEGGACGDGVIVTLDDGGDAGESCDTDRASPDCRDCHIVCEGVLDPSSQHCYFAAAPSESYGGAVQTCANARAHVVTFASEAEGVVVDRMADGGGYWVGLTEETSLVSGYEADRPEEPGWPRADSGATCLGCFARGADAGVFPSEEGVDGGGACVGSRAGRWFRAPCAGSSSRGVICEREPVGRRIFACTPFCTIVPATAGKKRYIVSLTPTTLQDARESCAVFDGALAVLDSREEREQLVHELREVLQPPFTVWIGLASTDGNTWTWADGVTDGSSRPSPWGDGQPKGVGEGQAYLRVRERAYDTQLAYSVDPTESPWSPEGALRYYACQLSP